MNKSKHERTREIQKSLETRERRPISHFDSRNYTQHNLGLEDGLEPILALMDSLPADRTKVNALRSFEDGDYSVAHLDYVLGDWGPMVGFEVHLWEDERIVEHWDNLQSTPISMNSSGRSMIDGATEVTDLERTEANKALVRDFTSTVLIACNIARVSDYHHGDALLQHDLVFGDGTAALAAHIALASNGGSGPIYERLHLLLGQGNMVLAASAGAVIADDGTRRPAAFYDLYRLDDGAIVEHWDVVEIIPPRHEWKNDNGKF